MGNWEWLMRNGSWLMVYEAESMRLLWFWTDGQRGNMFWQDPSADGLIHCPKTFAGRVFVVGSPVVVGYVICITH